MPIRPTIRLRLTLAYGAMFALAGILLLVVNYVLVRNSLHRDLVTVAIPGPAAPGTDVPPFGVEPLIVQGEPVSVEDFERRVRDETLSTLVVQSGQALVLMAVASLVLGWLIAGRVLKPVQDMTAAARRMSERSLHERLALEGPDDELKELGDTFDAMLARLETAFAGQRRFVANASHELRTPLSIIRAQIDVALADPNTSRAELRAMAETVRDATERSERLIDSLLVLARSDSGRATSEEVRLDEVATEVVDHNAAEAGEAGVTVSLDASPVVVLGDRPLLERLVANLVENGVHHNHVGGRVDVELFAADGGDGRTAQRTAVLRVSNTGPVVAADRVDALFEPFLRLGAERTGGGGQGVGLGLSIVRSVAAAHGGSVSARARIEGGLELEVRLPAAATQGLGRRGRQ
ncbi:MAG: ATP-binding protein [Actinomycetota bacterium]|nr:ATP-binding protein [Actinomycetota bacterium]